MSRKKRKIKKYPKSDDSYSFSSLVASKFIPKLMKNGNKYKVVKIANQISNYLKTKLKSGIDSNLEEAVAKLEPEVETKRQKFGGTIQQVPRKVKKERGVCLALKWLIQASQEKKGQPMYLSLSQEIMDAQQGKGAAYKKKEEKYKQAASNLAWASLSSFFSKGQENS